MRVAATVVGLAIAAGFYLLLIDTISLPELYAGAGVVVLALGAYEAARAQGLGRAEIDASWLVRGWRIIARVPAQCVVVSWEALAQLATLARRQSRGDGASRGEFRAVRFMAGGDSPRDTGRRALAEALGSLTPNTIVIGVDTERDLLLVHQLRRQGGRAELDPLELG